MVIMENNNGNNGNGNISLRDVFKILYLLIYLL